ncbi:MAG: adenylate/guanylate cyclase domain-containing protein [Elainellaceae cyanobacterium]
MTSIQTPQRPSLPANPLATILVVDDRLDNLHVLSEILEWGGYHVRKATSGAMAIRSAAEAAPDLVLLDVNMPMMDGYTVCRRLQADPSLEHLPIIFISALSDVKNQIEGFEAGGVDYVTKPFQADEVLARVKLQLNVQTLRHKLEVQAEVLQLQNEQLQSEIDQRKRAEETYRSLFENASEGIFQISPQGHYIAVNPKLARIYGYSSPTEMLASVVDANQQYVDGKHRAKLLRHTGQYGEVMEVVSQVWCKDGETIWISENIRAVFDCDGQVSHYEGTVQDVTDRVLVENLLSQDRQRTARLIADLLPPQIANRLRRSSRPFADIVDPAGILFADLVNFTEFSAIAPAQHTVALLNQIFSAFDELVDRYRLEKIKTIGDAYMVAAGVPEPRPDYLKAIAQLALDMQTTIRRFYKTDGRPFQLRIGIHSGAVVAGVIGKRKLTFDLWGHTVNLASRMEETSPPGGIQVSSEVCRQLRADFIFESCGSVAIQGVGPTQTYLLCGRRSPKNTTTPPGQQA